MNNNTIMCAIENVYRINNLLNFLYSASLWPKSVVRARELFCHNCVFALLYIVSLEKRLK